LACIRAASLDQTFDLLARHGDEALAGVAIDDGWWPQRAKNRTTRREVTGSAARCTGR
jgi:hypothetical protein